MYINTKSDNRQKGASLIEVLIAILIVAVGVLGLTKMQALTISNTQVSGARALVAMQASSLGALMHSNKGYWQVKLGNIANCMAASCTLTGSSTSKFGTPPSSCSSTSTCLPTAMAAYDINNWMAQMNQNIPGYTTIISCDGNLTMPVTCSIEITWLEKQAGGGTATASIAAATPAVAQAYYLYVQP